MRTQDPIDIVPIQFADIAKLTLMESSSLASEFIQWMESCTDTPFDDNVTALVVDVVMTYTAKIVSLAQVSMLGQLLSERDKEQVLAEVEEFSQIINAVKNLTEDSE